MYSTTQGSNIVILAGAISVIMNVIKGGRDLSTEDITAILSAGAIIVGAIVSWYARYKKGDVTVAGFKKS